MIQRAAPAPHARRNLHACTQGLALMLCATMAPAHAVPPVAPPPGIELVVLEKARYSDPEPIRLFSVQNLLSVDADRRATLNIHPERNPQHRDLVQLLSVGMPFDQPQVRNEIAAILASYPSACRDRLLVGLSVSPIEDIDTYVPNVKDKRRVSVLSVEDCLERQPYACKYTIRDNGAFDFDLAMLKRTLRNCRAALIRDIEQGSPIAEKAGNSP